MITREYTDLSSDRRIKFSRFLETNILSTLANHGFKGISKLRKIAKKTMPSVTEPVIVPTTLGFRLLVDPIKDKGLENILYHHGIYEAGTLYILRNILNPQDIFFDVGANIGLMSITASTVVGNKGHVYSFEPLKDICDIIQINIKINEIQNISVYNKALGSKKDRKPIFEHGEIRGSASLIKTEYNDREHIIEIDTVDNFISENKIEKVKAIKIDVEGWELEVLKGSNNLLSSIDAPIIIIEYSNLHPVHNGCLIDIYNFLLAVNKYEIYKLKRGKEVVSPLVKIETDKQLPEHDNLFCFLPSHKGKVSINL